MESKNSFCIDKGENSLDKQSEEEDQEEAGDGRADEEENEENKLESENSEGFIELASARRWRSCSSRFDW